MKNNSHLNIHARRPLPIWNVCAVNFNYINVCKKNSYMYSRPLYINFITMACCRFKSFILFILLDHAFSIRTSFSRIQLTPQHACEKTSSYLKLVFCKFQLYKCMNGLKCYQLYHVLPVCRLFPITNVYSISFLTVGGDSREKQCIYIWMDERTDGQGA
jgi:hypothetical protein